MTLKMTDFHKVEPTGSRGKKSGAIRMHITSHKYISFSKACVEALGNAERYELYVNDEYTMILLKTNAKGSTKKTRAGLNFCRKALAEKIVNKYSPGNPCPSVLGHYEFSLDGVLFDLRKLLVQGAKNE